MAYQLINLEQYATFESINEMDNTVRQYNATLNKSHYETLNLLKQYSCKVIGVSHIKVKTIADQLNKSVATIKRHIKFLKENGYITVINTFRVKAGGKGANAYAINPIEVQQKIKNELLKMNRRKANKNNAQYQSQQAMAFVQIKKETMSFIKLLTSFVSNKSHNKQVRLKRVENIKYFRACPENVPIELYEQYKPFFSDAQIKHLFNTITQQVNQFSNIDNEQYTNIVNNTFNSLIKALRNYYKGQSERINNIFAYATGAAKKQAFKQYNLNMWADVF